MDLPLSVQGLAATRIGVGATAVAVPSLLAFAFGLPPSDARTPMSRMGTTFFGIRELVLAGVTLGASADEPRGLRRALLVSAATDGLDLVAIGALSVRHPTLRRAVVLFAPASLLSVALHLRAARKVEVNK